MNSTNAGDLTVTALSQDTFGGNQEEEARAVLLWGEDPGLVKGKLQVRFPSSATSGQAGVVFGYKSANDYWLAVLDLDQNHKLYRVINGARILVASQSASVGAGSTESYYFTPNTRSFADYPDASLTDGYPSGRVGLYTNVAGTRFESISLYSDAFPTDVGGRWINFHQVHVANQAVAMARRTTEPL